MVLSESHVRALIDSLVGYSGPEGGETPNSPIVLAFLRGAFLNLDYIPSYTNLSTLRHKEGLRLFRSYLEAVLAVLVESGIECAPEGGPNATS